MTGLPADTTLVVHKQEMPSPRGATAVAGYTGHRDRRQYLAIDDTLLKEFRGSQARKTIDRMMADAVIAGTVTRTGLLLRAPEWQLEPGGEDAIDVEFRDFVVANLDRLEPGWPSTVASSADMIAWGFTLHEVLFERDGGFIVWAGFSPRDQRTIERWHEDRQTGRLLSVEQRLDSGERATIEAWKLLHFRTDPASGRPEGRSLLRNAFLAWTDKQEFRRIIKTGVRRDLTGMPQMEVPVEMLSADATPAQLAARAEFERMVREVERDLREGLVTPSRFAADGTTQSGYDFKLVTSGGKSRFDVEKLMMVQNREIAIGLLAEFVLLGHEQVGTQALAGTKTSMFERAIVTWLDAIGEHMAKRPTKVLQALNPRYAAAQLPKWQHSDIEPKSILDFGQGIAQLISSGGILPDPALDRWLRQELGAPESEIETPLGEVV